MRIKYETEQNEAVLAEFLKLVFKNYLFPLAINMVILFFLFFVSINCIFRSVYEGFISVRLYEVLMIPLMIIPIVNTLQTIVMIYLGIHKITTGDYVVDRYRCSSIRNNTVHLSDSIEYKHRDFTSYKQLVWGENVDMVSIINNYGTIIWKIGIPPKSKLEVELQAVKIDRIFEVAKIPIIDVGTVAV